MLVGDLVLTTVVRVLLAGALADTGALHEPSAALGTASGHDLHQRHGERTLRPSRTRQETSETPGLDDQVPSALGTDLLRHLLRDLDPHALQSLLRRFQIALEAAVEALEHRLPRGLPLLHGVQLPLHPGRELQVRDVGEAFLHELRHDPAQVRDLQVLALLGHVLPVQDRGHRGRVSGRASDPLLLHGPDQGGVRIAGGGLGEVLLGIPSLPGQDLSLPEGRQGRGPLLLLLVLPLLVDGGIARELQTRRRGSEIVPSRPDVHRYGVIDRVGHLTGQEAAPDQTVEVVLLPGQVLLHLFRRPLHVAGTDRLVGVLGVALRLVPPGRLRAVRLPVAGGDEAPCGGDGLFGQTQGVGPHIRDEPHGPLALDLHAFIKLLGDGHGAPGRHVQLPGRLLLEGGRGEGRGRTALLLPALHLRHGERLSLRLPDDRVHVVPRMQFAFLAVGAVPAGQEGLRGVAQLRVQGPVFLRLERLDLPLPVVHHPRGHGLDPSRREAPADLLPQEGAQFVAHQTVQDAPGLLGVHQILVDLPGGPDALLHHLLRDLVERDPPGLVVRQVQELFEMPGDGLPLPVRVRGEIDRIRLLRGLRQVPDHVLFPLDGLVDRLEALLHVHAQLALGQVPQMAHAGLHLIPLAQISPDGLGFRRRLHDDQVPHPSMTSKTPLRARSAASRRSFLTLPGSPRSSRTGVRCAGGRIRRSPAPSGRTGPAGWGCRRARSRRPPPWGDPGTGSS